MIDVGQRVRDYQIVAHLKPGGMATLFLARRVGPQGFARPVAIKVVHPHLASDPELVRMFVDEARLSACIQHPNVVHVEELGEVDGTFFLAMEYLHGESLSSLLAALARVERRLSVEDAAWIISGAAAGLHAAHETRDGHGTALALVHRDVSPQNVLVSIDGHVKVIDFGIAKAKGAAAHTEAGVVKGKLAYMSPEQARGEPVDRRTDVYALGIVLWEMLAMRRLFAGLSEVQLYDAIRNPRIEPPSALAPDVSPALDDVVLRALAVDPDERFATAEDLQRALGRAVPGAAAGPSGLARVVREMLGDRIEARRHEIASGGLDADPTVASGVRTATTGARVADARAVAVMPFRTIGGSDGSLGDGLADELRDVLSRVRGLRIKARAGARDAEDASAYGERLGVGFVVTGRVHVEPSRLRVAVALTNVDDGFQIGSSRIERPLAEVWGALDDVARSVVEALGHTKLRGERPAADAGTVELALELRRVASQPVIADAGVVLTLHARVLAVAPRDPVILASCATALVRTTYWSSPSPQIVEMARAAIDRAIELAPELPEPWVALAQLRLADADSAGAVRALGRAIANGPSVAEAHDLLARILSDADLLDEALRLAEHALWLEPKSSFARREKVRIHALRGDWDATARELAILKAENAEHYTAIATRVALYAGRPIGERIDVETTPGMQHLASIAWRVAATRQLEPGDLEAVEAAIAGAAQPRARRFFHQLKAELLACAGRRDATIAAVIAAVDAGLEDLAWLDRCPLLRDVRHDAALARPAALVRERADAVRRAWDEW